MEKVFEIIEIAKRSGQIKRGANEVTKAIERGKAKFIAVATDVSPKEVIMHIPLLAKEKGVPCAEVDKKIDLGAASGLPVGTAAVVVLKEGEAAELIKKFKGE